jgi:hypothetical protein
MPVIAPTFVTDRGSVLVTWTPLANGDTGGPVDLPSHSDRTIQVTGTFGVGGSVTIEGANVGTYTALTDPQGNAVTKTVAAIEALEEAPKLTRPNVTAGDGTTALTVTMYCRRSIR